MGTSLIVQFLRVHLPMQGTQVRSLVRGLRSHILQDRCGPARGPLEKLWRHHYRAHVLVSPSTTTGEKPGN